MGSLLKILYVNTLQSGEAELHNLQRDKTIKIKNPNAIIAVLMINALYNVQTQEHFIWHEDTHGYLSADNSCS